MLCEDPKRPHRVTLAYMRQTITDANDPETFDNANRAYISAKVAWSTINNDETMINLIGSWARLNKIIREMDDKYGIRR
jgi:hypothetical protein